MIEQKRIIDKLDAVLERVDACRERLDRVPTILKRFRQCVLTAAASGNLTEEWRDARPATSVTEWQMVTLGDLCENSFYGPRFGKSEYTVSETGVPTIRTTDMEGDGRIKITANTPKVIISPDKIEQFRVRRGDYWLLARDPLGSWRSSRRTI